MKTIVKYTSLLALLAMVVLLAVDVVSFNDIAGLFLGTAGVTSMAIAGGVTTANMNTANSDVLYNEFEKTMTLIKPDEYPLDQLIRNTKKAYSWEGWKVTYPSVETRPIADTVATGAAEQTTNTPGITSSIVVTNGGQWLVDDLMFFKTITAYGGKPLRAQVITKSTNTLTVMAINGYGATTNDIGYKIPAITTGTSIARYGNAKHETAASTAIYNAVPASDHNYMQIHMGQIEESILYKQHAKQIKYDLALQRLLAMYNFRNEAEASALFGARNMLSDGTNLKYFSGGAEYFIENTLTYGTAENTTTFREQDWVSITKNIFSGNSGSSRRVMFVGKDLMASIANIDTISKQLKASDSEEIIWGVRFSKVMTDFGTLLVKYHKMFDYFGYESKGMIIDTANVDKYVWEPFQKTELEFDKTGTARVESQRFHETSCFTFKYPDTHALITPHAYIK